MSIFEIFEQSKGCKAENYHLYKAFEVAVRLLLVKSNYHKI